MVLNVSLDHLHEDEIKFILAVLERDAEIQRRDEVRKRRLQKSVRGERIPQKRLSVKCKTGEWLSDIADPERAPKEKGTEVVRASIRRKRSSKTKPLKPFELEKVGALEDEEETGRLEKEVIASSEVGKKENTDDQQEPTEGTGYSVFYDENKSYSTPTYKDEGAKSDESYAPKRKTSFRRKKIQTTADKQVKFDTENTEKYVYEPMKVDGEHVDKKPDQEAKKEVPTIVIDDSSDYTEAAPKEEEKVDSYSTAEPIKTTKDDEVSYEDNVYTPAKTFESYHHNVGKAIFTEETKGEDKPHPDKQEKTEEEKPKATKVVKKVKVVKRMGSSRKRGGQKITDDSSRNDFFGQAEEEKKSTEQTKQEIEKAKEEVIVTPDYKKDDAKEAEKEISKEHDEHPPAYEAEPVVPAPYVQASMDESINNFAQEVIGEIKSSQEKANEYTSSVIENIEKEKPVDSYDDKPAVTVDVKEEYKPEPPVEPYQSDKAPKTVAEAAEEQPQYEREEQKDDFLDEVTKAMASVMQKSSTHVPQETEEKHSYPSEEVAFKEIEKPVTTYAEDTKKEEKQQELEDYVEPVKVIEEPPAKEEEEEKGSPAADKPKKKVVKRVIKKKVKASGGGEENTSPKLEQKGQDEGEEEEEKSQNMSQLQRTKTVRKKVIRRKAPPQQTS